MPRMLLSGSGAQAYYVFPSRNECRDRWIEMVGGEAEWEPDTVEEIQKPEDPIPF